MSTWETGWQALRALPSYEIIPLLGIPVYFVAVLLVTFTIRSLIWGMPRAKRVSSGSHVLPRFFLEYGYWTLQVHVKVFTTLRISANGVTYLSLAFAAAGAVGIGAGSFCLGGWLMFLSFFCDAFDGLVARATGTASPRGEFLDATIDRYGDLLTSFGYFYYYRNDPIPLALAGLMTLGSSVMSYARAKGEAVGIDPNVGFMQRHERATYLGILTVLSPISSAFIEPGAAHPLYHPVWVAMGLIGIFTNITAIWRTAYVMKRLPRPGQTAQTSKNDSNPTPKSPGTNGASSHAGAGEHRSATDEALRP
jgi:CDP-diacylglycerol--glycerol-3-phosphate 3-phosphatidyltransferase